MKNHGCLAGGEAARPEYRGRFARRWQDFWFKRPLRLRAVSLDQRLKAGVTIDPKTGCHLGTGSKKSRIYGGMHILTHRLAWALANGPIPDGLFVLHRCDNPASRNPDHLYLGTQPDNMADMMRKGRARGPRVGGKWRTPGDDATEASSPPRRSGRGRTPAAPGPDRGRASAPTPRAR